MINNFLLLSWYFVFKMEVIYAMQVLVEYQQSI
jgi:hypothetical protein